MNKLCANFSTNILNGQQNYKNLVQCSASKLSLNLCLVLFQENLIRGFYVDRINKKSRLVILLKYGSKVGKKNLNKIMLQKSYTHIKAKNYKNGLQIYILSTPKGCISNFRASQLKLGGIKLIKIL